jgi:hypothetical protein
MINVPAGTRILLVTRPVDFPNYVARTVMWSPRSVSIFFLCRRETWFG